MPTTLTPAAPLDLDAFLAGIEPEPATLTGSAPGDASEVDEPMPVRRPFGPSAHVSFDVPNRDDIHEVSLVFIRSTSDRTWHLSAAHVHQRVPDRAGRRRLANVIYVAVGEPARTSPTLQRLADAPEWLRSLAESFDAAAELG